MPPAYLKSSSEDAAKIAAAECFGKVGFESYNLAATVARRKRKERPRKLYRCPTCGKYHLSAVGW